MLPDSPKSSFPSSASTPDPNALRILIVEDEPDIARLIAVTLAPLKLDLRMATTGTAALEAFASVQPHLILLDLMLPEIDGRTICAKIRETSTVPIIMMTALDSEIDEMSGLKVGADDYIMKPFNPKLLAARVAAQLRRVYRYDGQATREETEADRQRKIQQADQARRQKAIDQAVGRPTLDTSERKLPQGWASCDTCGYMGPRGKFDKEDAMGRKSAACPVCNSTESLVFSLG